MVEISPTASQIQRAKKKALEMGKIKNSITSGEGNVAGFLGEIIFADYYGLEISNTYDHDVIVLNGTADVKTKRCTSKPRDHYLCAIADYNTKQGCDFYVFLRVLNNYTKAWILGWIPKEDFFKQAEKNKKGELDPTSPPNTKFYFTADCHNLPIKKLNQLYEKRN